MKKILCLLLVSAMLMLLCGCNSDVPDLTPEQAALISEYATHLLVKHSELSDRNLLNEKELEEGIIAEAEERERKIKADEIAQSYLNKEVEMIDGAVMEEEDGDAGEDLEVVPMQAIGEFFGEDRFTIDYSSYELCKSYPAEGEEEFFMAMDATVGNQLCVVKFSVRNVTSQDSEFNMIGKNSKYMLQTADGETIPAQATLLLDDLSSYKGTIAANATEQMVLVFEVDDSVTQMDSSQLVMKNNGGGENVVPLQ